jgi:hypothetical protein
VTLTHDVTPSVDVLLLQRESGESRFIFRAIGDARLANGRRTGAMIAANSNVLNEG